MMHQAAVNTSAEDSSRDLLALADKISFTDIIFFGTDLAIPYYPSSVFFQFFFYTTIFFRHIKQMHVGSKMKEKKQRNKQGLRSE